MVSFRFTSSSLHLLLVLLFFEVQNSAQISGRNVDSWNSGQNPDFIIRNGDQIDLSLYPGFSHKIKLSNSTIMNTRTFFQSLEIRFSVKPPENHGIILVVQEMNLRRPSSRPFDDLRSCGGDYVKFIEIGADKSSGPICGTLSRHRNASEKMLGPRTFVTEINKGIGVHFFSGNGYVNLMQTKVMADRLNQSETRDIEVVLVFTAYSECSGANKLGNCDSAQTQCISPNLFCDRNFNCGFDPNSTQSTDEANCTNSESEAAVTNTDDGTNSDTDSGKVQIFNVITSSISSTTPSSSTTYTGRTTTVFPYWLLLPPSSPTTSTVKPNTWINWNLNIYKTPSTTTRPIILFTHNQYDNEPEPSGPSWARRLPAFQVVFIFISVVFLIFLTCTVLARMNTINPNLFNGASNLSRSPRNSRMTAQPLDEGSTHGDVVILNQGAEQFNSRLTQSPPPSYRDVSDLPPSYNTLFSKR